MTGEQKNRADGDEMTAINDFNDYGKDTRARRWLAMIFARPLHHAVKALLWLCPDTVIVANVKIAYRGAAVYIESASKGMIRTGILVRIDVTGQTECAGLGWEATATKPAQKPAADTMPRDHDPEWGPHDAHG